MAARRLGDPSEKLWETLGFGPPISAVSPAARGVPAVLAAQSQSVLFRQALPVVIGGTPSGITGAGDSTGEGPGPGPGDGDGSGDSDAL